MSSEGWLQADPAGRRLTLRIHVQPGAKSTEVVGLHGDALKIRVASPPVDGKANAKLIAFLAERLQVSKGNIELLAGDSSRAKRQAITGVDETMVRERLFAG